MADLKLFYKNLKRDIPAGGVVELNIFGRTLEILSWTGTLDPLVSIGDNAEQELPPAVAITTPEDEQGKPIFFSKIRIKNPNASVSSIEVAIAPGKITDSRVTISGELNADISTNVIETPAKITANNTLPSAVSIPADTAQRELIIYNQSVNDIWYGDANVDGSNGRGIILGAGQKEVLTTEAELFLHAPAGNSDLSYMRLKR